MSEINRNPVLLTIDGIPQIGLLAHWLCDIVYKDHHIISLINVHGSMYKFNWIDGLKNSSSHICLLYIACHTMGNMHL